MESLNISTQIYCKDRSRAVNYFKYGFKLFKSGFFVFRKQMMIAKPLMIAKLQGL